MRNASPPETASGPASTPIVDLSSTTKKIRKQFEFLNLKLNHVDSLIPVSDPEYVDQATIAELMEELDEKNEFYIFQKAKSTGLITKLQTTTKNYHLESNYIDEVKSFESTFNFDSIKIDAIEDSLLSEFVCRGMHYNLTGY